MATPGDVFTGLFGDSDDWSEAFDRSGIWFDQVFSLVGSKIEDGSLYPTQEKFDSTVAAWNRLTPRVRKALAMGALAILWILILGPVITGLILTPPVVAYVLSLKKPHPESFREFFRHWFKKEWYPRIADDMQKRIDEKYEEQSRTSRSSIFGTLRTVASSVMLKSTRTLQAEIACSAVTSRSTVEFTDYYVLYWGSLNVSGDSSKPTMVSFVGFNGKWHAMPRWERGRLVNSLPSLDLRGLARDVAAKSNISASLPSFHRTNSDESVGSNTSSVRTSKSNNRESSRRSRRMKSTRTTTSSIFG